MLQHPRVRGMPRMHTHKNAMLHRLRLLHMPKIDDHRTDDLKTAMLKVAIHKIINMRMAVAIRGMRMLLDQKRHTLTTQGMHMLLDQRRHMLITRGTPMGDPQETATRLEEQYLAEAQGMHIPPESRAVGGIETIREMLRISWPSRLFSVRYRHSVLP